MKTVKALISILTKMKTPEKVIAKAGDNAKKLQTILETRIDKGVKIPGELDKGEVKTLDTLGYNININNETTDEGDDDSKPATKAPKKVKAKAVVEEEPEEPAEEEDDDTPEEDSDEDDDGDDEDEPAEESKIRIPRGAGLQFFKDFVGKVRTFAKKDLVKAWLKAFGDDKRAGLENYLGKSTKDKAFLGYKLLKTKGENGTFYTKGKHPEPIIIKGKGKSAKTDDDEDGENTHAKPKKGKKSKAKDEDDSEE